MLKEILQEHKNYTAISVLSKTIDSLSKDDVAVDNCVNVLSWVDEETFTPELNNFISNEKKVEDIRTTFKNSITAFRKLDTELVVHGLCDLCGLCGICPYE